MSAFNETMYSLRLQLIDNHGKVIDSVDSPKMNWLRLQDQFNRHKKSWVRSSNNSRTEVEEIG